MHSSVLTDTVVHRPIAFLSFIVAVRCQVFDLSGTIGPKNKAVFFKTDRPWLLYAHQWHTMNLRLTELIPPHRTGASFCLRDPIQETHGGEKGKGWRVGENHHARLSVTGTSVERFTCITAPWSIPASAPHHHQKWEKPELPPPWPSQGAFQWAKRRNWD